jgi:catechol 2,3-dioxygenase-like lactoylglutathione lyase family enzyme
MIQGMNHFTILTADVDRTIAFYRRFLDLEPGARPDLGFPGAWMYAKGGSDAILHVIGGRSLPLPPPGVIDHMAFTASGLLDHLERLESAGIKHVVRRQRGSNTWQVFFDDPNGAKVELDFDPAEAGPPG